MITKTGVYNLLTYRRGTRWSDSLS